MESQSTLLLTRKDVAGLLGIGECITAVEQVFRLYAEGKIEQPKVLGIHTGNGSFHIKAGVGEKERNIFVVKINANYPDNPKQYGLPSIQGIIAAYDSCDGRLLALIDSIEISIIRTGAATGVAAKYLALPEAKVATICGCGNQGRISLKALLKVRDIKKVYAFDNDERQSGKIAEEFASIVEVITITENDLPVAIKQSNILVTCTPSKKPFVHAEYISPGTFIAAVGADNPEKQELFPDLLQKNKIITDLTEQSASIGELYHAIKNGLITSANVHAELGEIIAGKKPGRESGDEIIIFDSTGTALQDAAAVAIVYEKAMASGIGNKMNFANL